jgi:hypothetical protein
MPDFKNGAYAPVVVAGSFFEHASRGHLLYGRSANIFQPESNRPKGQSMDERSKTGKKTSATSNVVLGSITGTLIAVIGVLTLLQKMEVITIDMVSRAVAFKKSLSESFTVPNLPQQVSQQVVGQTESGHEWLLQMKANEWSWATTFINDKCKPTDLSGIQIVSPLVNKKLSNDYQFYVACRSDDESNVRYKVCGTVVDSLDQCANKIKEILSKPDRKLGPLYYGSQGNYELWWVEKLRTVNNMIVDPCPNVPPSIS